MQVRGQGDFYRELRNKGFFINAPDDYFFQGTNKEGVGYNENQFSLPRLEELVVTRATLFEGTFIMPPTVSQTSGNTTPGCGSFRGTRLLLYGTFAEGPRWVE